jgi:DUF971 family protein
MSDAPGAAPWPVEIRRHRADGSLSVEFDTGETVRLSGPLLRAATPSAADRGHGAPSHELLAGDFSGVCVLEVRPVGAYAVRLVFSDGHDTGLYSFETLHRLGARGASTPASAAGGG